MQIRANRLMKSMDFGRARKYLFKRDQIDPNSLPFGAVYIFFSFEGDVLYVGTANSVGGRIKDHLDYNSHIALCMDYVHYIGIIRGVGEEAEKVCIGSLNPVFNSTLSSDPFITIKRELISRSPKFKDYIIRATILGSRRFSGVTSAGLSPYSEITDQEDIDILLDRFNILVNEEESE